MDRLKGKVAVITGGNSGVGEATAKLFAKEGAVVVITARREAALTKVAEEIKAAGGEAFAVSTDISKPEDPERLMELVLKKYGKIDILINNAGILETGLKPIDRFLDEDLDRIVETNQKGTMRCMRAAARRMQSGASIVNVASVAGVKGLCRFQGCRDRCDQAHCAPFPADRHPLQCDLPREYHHTDDDRN
mgnify:CR=1 FL=1